MSATSIEHHLKAAEHHEQAARHHREAARHYAEGRYQEAIDNTRIASGHLNVALLHSAEAFHVERHVTTSSLAKNESNAKTTYTRCGI